MDDCKSIEISEKEYKELLADREKLYALEGYGVDNWAGYGDAMQSIKGA